LSGWNKYGDTYATRETCHGDPLNTGEVEEETIRCPQMVFGKKRIERPNMRASECKTRRRHNKECRTCTYEEGKEDVKTGG
jgi:hypothetical protein